MVPGKGSLAISRIGQGLWLPGLAPTSTGSQPARGWVTRRVEGELRPAFGWTNASHPPCPRLSLPQTLGFSGPGNYLAAFRPFPYRIRMSGIKGLQGVVRKTVNDELQANIWDPQHMDKIVPSLLFNLQHVEEAER